MEYKVNSEDVTLESAVVKDEVWPVGRTHTFTYTCDKPWVVDKCVFVLRDTDMFVDYDMDQLKRQAVLYFNMEK